MNKRKRIVAIIVAVALVVFAPLMAWTIWANQALQLNTYAFINENLPAQFNGFKIAHVSDLHNSKIGNTKAIDLLKEGNPDIIAITGDLVDSRRTNVDRALAFIEQAVKIAPCYYCTGNHEAQLEEEHNLKQRLSTLGVTVLDDKKVEIDRNGDKLVLMGIDDPIFKEEMYSSEKVAVKSILDGLVEVADGFTMLLSHRPELFEVYADYGIDLVLSGHVHGGQIRLPFIGGLYGPSQGLFPKYDAGAYCKDETTMYVSRGVGNSAFPLRFNNRPEIILITMQTNG